MNFMNIFHWFNRPPALPRETVAFEQLQRANALWGANPDRIALAVTAYNAGNISQLARVVDEYEQRDDVVRSCVRKRDAAVARCEHTVLIEEGHEDDPRAQLHRDILLKFWAGVKVTSAFNRAQRGSIRLLKKQMMSALSTGYSCHNIVWDTRDPQNLTATFIQIPAWHFENLTGELRFRPTIHQYYGETMAEGAWLVHAADPIGPAVALAACAKRMGLQDWMLFSERAAIPGLLAKTDAAYGTDAWNRLVQMLRAWGRDWRGITDRNTDLTTVSLNNNGTPPMPGLVDRMDRAIAALYRGADLSTISKGEGLGASLQGDEADMLEADDCAALAESLHEQVDRFVIRWATGDTVPLAYVWIEPTAKPDIEKEIRIDDHLVSHGARLSLRDALQRYGRAETDPKDPADRALEPPQQPQNAPFGGLANERRPAPSLQTALPAFKTPSKKPDGQGEVSGADASEGVLEAFSKDTSKAAAEVRKLLDLMAAGKEREAASFAATLAANIQSLMPDDPEMATVIMDAMATSFAEAWDDTAALANSTDANGAEHAAAGSDNGGQFVSKDGGSSGAPSDKTEKKVRSVKSSPKADGQARACGYADVKDMMAQAENVPAERITAIQDGYSGKCKAHEAIAVISENKPFTDAEGNKVDFGGDILEHYIEGRRRRDNEPKVGNLEDLPYAIKAVKTDTYGVTRLKYPKGTTPDPLDPPRGTQREYHLPTDRGQMKVFVYIQGGHINGWHVEQ